MRPLQNKDEIRKSAFQVISMHLLCEVSVREWELKMFQRTRMRDKILCDYFVIFALARFIKQGIHLKCFLKYNTQNILAKQNY